MTLCFRLPKLLNLNIQFLYQLNLNFFKLSKQAFLQKDNSLLSNNQEKVRSS